MLCHWVENWAIFQQYPLEIATWKTEFLFQFSMMTVASFFQDGLFVNKLQACEIAYFWLQERVIV